MPFHRIKLRGPWEYRWIKGFANPVPPAGTIAMPCEWSRVFGDASGTAEFRRRFHKPTNLEPHERVLITLTEVRGRGTVSLNAMSLGEFASEGESVRFDMTSCLKSFNELTIEIAFDPSVWQKESGGLFGVVAIEIGTDS